MSRARGYAGLSKLRKTLKRMEPTIQREFHKALESAGQELKQDAVMFASMKNIKDSGDLIASIDYKVGSGGSTVVVGPGAAALTWQKKPWDNQSAAAMKLSRKQKHMKWQFFKGYWAEFGTKGDPSRGIPEQPARPFMGPAWDNNKAGLQKRFGALLKESLRLTSEGR